MISIVKTVFCSCERLRLTSSHSNVMYDLKRRISKPQNCDQPRSVACLPTTFLHVRIMSGLFCQKSPLSNNEIFLSVFVMKEQSGSPSCVRWVHAQKTVTPLSNSFPRATHSDISGYKNAQYLLEVVAIHREAVLSMCLCGHTLDWNTIVHFHS
ncbi:hypothetical protein KCU59_g85, partial [Aureobasidium melanogenum]